MMHTHTNDRPIPLRALPGASSWEIKPAPKTSRIRAQDVIQAASASPDVARYYEAHISTLGPESLAALKTLRVAREKSVRLSAKIDAIQSQRIFLRRALATCVVTALIGVEIGVIVRYTRHIDHDDLATKGSPVDFALGFFGFPIDLLALYLSLKLVDSAMAGLRHWQRSLARGPADDLKPVGSFPQSQASTMQRLAVLPELTEALHTAVENRNIHEVAFLGSVGLPMDLFTDDSRTALTKVVDAGDAELCRILLTYGAEALPHHLTAAIAHRNVPLVEHLLTRCRAQDKAQLQQCVDAHEILQAVKLEDEALLGVFLRALPVSVAKARINTVLGGEEGSAVHYAVANDLHNTFALLLQFGGDVSLPDRHGTAADAWFSSNQEMRKIYEERAPLPGDVVIDMDVLAHD